LGTSTGHAPERRQRAGTLPGLALRRAQRASPALASVRTWPPPTSRHEPSGPSLPRATPALAADAIVSNGPSASLLPCAHAEVRSPYRGINAGHPFAAKARAANAAYLSGAMLPHTSHAQLRSELPLSLTVRPPPYSHLLRPSPLQPTPLATSLGTPGADCAALFVAPAESSPESELQRPPVRPSTEPHHRQPLYPNQAHKSVTGKPLVLLLTFLGRPRRRSRRILAGRAAPSGLDHIALVPFFPGSNL
jgi:hypothetical protein